MFKILLIILVLVTIVYCYKLEGEKKLVQNNIIQKPIEVEKQEEFVDTDKLYFNRSNINGDFTLPLKETSEIEFNYTIRPEDKDFLEEQEEGVNLNTWYSNTYIEKIGEDGKPIWGSREKETGKKDMFVQEHTRMTYDFNEPKSIHMDGVVSSDAVGTKISDVYDNYFVDFKKLTPPKKLKTDTIDMMKTEGASNLDFFAPDTWSYDNEKLENGGMISNGLYASDPTMMNPVASF